MSSSKWIVVICYICLTTIFLFYRPTPANIIKLEGPHSPLHMRFISFLRSSNKQHVLINANSVNMYPLDVNYITNNCYVISALQITKTRFESLSLNETTMFPQTQGLFTKLSLLWAPRVQLRLNKNEDGYTSCVGGLGIFPQLCKENDDKKPAAAQDFYVNAERNLETLFDIEINNEDISDVNFICKLTSALLTTTSFQDNSFEKNNEIRVAFLKQLSRFVKHLFY